MVCVVCMYVGVSWTTKIGQRNVLLSQSVKQFIIYYLWWLHYLIFSSVSTQYLFFYDRINCMFTVCVCFCCCIDCLFKMFWTMLCFYSERMIYSYIRCCTLLVLRLLYICMVVPAWEGCATFLVYDVCCCECYQFCRKMDYCLMKN